MIKEKKGKKYIYPFFSLMLLSYEINIILYWTTEKNTFFDMVDFTTAIFQYVYFIPQKAKSECYKIRSKTGI